MIAGRTFQPFDWKTMSRLMTVVSLFLGDLTPSSNFGVTGKRSTLKFSCSVQLRPFPIGRNLTLCHDPIGSVAFMVFPCLQLGFQLNWIEKLDNNRRSWSTTSNRHRKPVKSKLFFVEIVYRKLCGLKSVPSEQEASRVIKACCGSTSRSRNIWSTGLQS